MKPILNCRRKSLLLVLTVTCNLAFFQGTTPAHDQIAHAVEQVVVQSPGGSFTAAVSLDEDGQPRYSVKHASSIVIQPSGMGLKFLDGNGETLDATRQFQSLEVVEQSDHDANWTPVWGERSTVQDRYRQTLVRFRGGKHGLQLDVEFRVYDEGVALRYVVDKSSGTDARRDPIRIASEQTEFRFVDDHQVWAVTSAQGKYSRMPISELKHSVERPCVLETTHGKVIAIAEAGLVDYARMRLRRAVDKQHTLVSALHRDKNAVPVVSPKPLKTPWRVVMAADSAGDLLEQNDLILNLNQPCEIADTSWIKPGKVIREVTLSTDGGKSCVDFAVANGLQFVEFDAGWYGNQGDDKSDARTVARPNLDLPEVIRYAREQNIGVLLYVNRRHLERQLDDLLPLYREWGIAGIKFGFVQHGSQQWTAWMHDAIRKAANHQLMVDVHDEYRMTGWQRTYPNFMTAEGIGGDETRPTNHQALTNLFTRMIAAPADHTFCYYNNYVDETTSHASQLAKTVCFFSPWQFLFWYDRPATAQNEPELEFFKHLPTTWDETRVLHGRIGEYAVIARRNQDDWFIGCLNAGQTRTLKVPLDFLPEGVECEARIYRDDATVSTRTKVRIDRRRVDSKTVLKAVMSEKGGMAVWIDCGNRS